MSHSKPKHIEILQEFSLPLIAGVLVAIAWANLGHESYHHFLHWSPFGHDSHFNFHFLMNDLFMALFFGLAAKEISESVLPGGALNPMKKAINPLLGTLGGVIGPVCVFFIFVWISGDAAIGNGWGIPTATDIALAWLVARMVFGKEHPAVSFLLLLAVADDAIGLGIIAVFYPDPNHPVQPIYLAVVGAACGLAYALRKKEVTNFWPYLVGPGVMSWTGLYMASLHPALALVAIVPFMPSGGHDEGLFAESEGYSDYSPKDTLNRFEHFFKLPVDIGLFGFGLANAGVEFSSMGDATLAVFMALAIGKTLGIFTFSTVGTKLGFPLPEGMDWKSLLTAGCVAGLGLTVALFVAGVAFTDPTLQGAAKMGALFSAFIAPLAMLLGKVLRVKEDYAKFKSGSSQTEVVEVDMGESSSSQPEGMSAREEDRPSL
ncbi:MAG: Na+/H+ antiporter NhaA [Bdellovibrionales bacterium]|nr:Na+/H+ antiporter NhaA [Bdellovibrionales bacterium]